MIKFTLEFVILMVIVTLCLIVALSLMLGKLLPYLLVGGVILFVYSRSKKSSNKCPDCELKEFTNHDH